MTSCKAYVDDGYLEFTIAEALLLDTDPTNPSTPIYEIAASTAVNLPATVARVSDPTAAQTIHLSTEAGEVRAAVNYLTPRAGTFTKTELKPVSDIVGSDTTLQVSLTTAHAVPKQGLLQIRVTAPWNDGAPGAAVPYFSAVACSDFTIGGKPVPAVAYTCAFWDDESGGGSRYRLELSGGFEDGVLANTDIKLNIAGFRNPMSANEAFPVFQVETTGPNSLHIVDKAVASVTVSTAAALTAAVFRVARIEAATPGLV